MTFRVGQKVVCVNDMFDHPSWQFVPNRPVAGQVYTIRQITEFNFTSEPNAAAVYLGELVNPIHSWRYNGHRECPFAVERFRPLVSRTTDISALKALLVPGAKIRETA